MTGSLYKRGKIWWMAYYVDGIQHCVSAGTANKRLAQKILNLRLAEVIEGRFQLPKTNPPRFKQFSGEFLDSIGHQNTKKRYTTSVKKLREHFGDIRLSEFSLDRIEGYKEARRKAKVRSATINRDLAVLRCILRVALRKRLIAPNSLPVIEMLEERKERRQPHILTFNEERKLMAAAADHIRVLAVLILDAGLRSGKEALALKWENIDFANDSIRIKESKTHAGLRSVPMSKLCKAELLNWRARLGHEFSEYVFAKPNSPQNHLRDVRCSWANALDDAGLPYFWVYDLRHTFASRLTQKDVSPICVAQLLGHSNANIVGTYAKAVDEYRRSAIARLDDLREAWATAGHRHLIQ